MFRPGNPLPDTHAGRSQPRPVENARRPNAAERVRTLVQSSVSAMLTIPGAEADELGSGSPEARTVTPEGDVVLLVPADSPAAQLAAYAQDDDVPAVMEITDVAPVSVPHRIRGRAWVGGWLTAVRNAERTRYAEIVAQEHPHGPLPGAAWTLVRLEVGEAHVDDLWDTEHVEPDEFAAAAPDPLAPHEAELLQHLASAHQDEVRGLCALLGEPTSQTGAERCRGVGTSELAVPLALDQHGLRVRFCTDGRCQDARFEFPQPVESVTELRRAMHTLFRAAEER